MVGLSAQVLHAHLIFSLITKVSWKCYKLAPFCHSQMPSAHQGRVDSPGIDLLPLTGHAQDSWLHHSMFVVLDFWVHFVEAGVSRVLPTGYLHFNQTLFIQVVAQCVSGV